MDALLSLLLGIIKSSIFLYSLALVGASLWPTARTHALVAGVATVIFFAWFSIQCGLALGLFAPLMLILAGVGLCIRDPGLPNYHSSIRPLFADFALFYTLAFLFSWPPVGGAVLPIPNIANTDILNYMNTASYLQRLGAENIATLSYLKSSTFIYAFTPGVHIALALMALLYDGDVMQTMMPFMFMVVGVIGCVVVRLCQSFCGLSRSSALGVAAIMLTGPYFWYIVHFYFLSSLVGMAIFLSILMAQASVLSYIPYYFTLFYAYPPLFVLTLVAQSILNLLTKPSNILASLMAAGLVLLIDPLHSLEVMGWLLHITTPGITGWPLDMISPLALLGLPSYLETHAIWSIALGCALFSFIILRAPHIKPVMILCLLAILSFYAYALVLGPSYQQWKFGTYLALPLMWVVWALLSTYCRPTLFIALSLIIVCGNAAWHLTHNPAPNYYSADYKKLRLIESLVSDQHVDIHMNTFTTNYLPAYFIRNKTLHFMSPSSYPMEAHVPGRAYFIEGAPCNSPLDSIGCLRYNSQMRQGRQYED